MIHIYVANVFDGVDILGLTKSIKFIGLESVEYQIRFMHSKSKSLSTNAMSLETASVNEYFHFETFRKDPSKYRILFQHYMTVNIKAAEQYIDLFHGNKFVNNSEELCNVCMKFS